MEYQHLFIFGPPRSGTTALQGSVCAALGSRFMPESNYITDILDLYARVVDYPDPVRFPYYFNDGHPAANLYRDCANKIIAYLGAREDGPVTVFKDPMMSAVATRARDILGSSSRFLCVVRHPADVMASMKRVRARSGVSWDLEADTMTVFRCYYGIGKLADLGSSGDLVVRYEDVASRDQLTLANIGGFIGANITDLANNPSWLSQTDEFKSEGYGKPIDKKYAGEGHISLTENELAEVQMAFSGVMARWDYEPKS